MMLDEVPLPCVDAAELYFFIKWFADLRKILQNPHLNDEEKLLWLWLATQCANDMSFSCSMSIEQISLALNKPPRLIHRCLFRLLIMGFLIADIPIHYGEPTPEMAKKERILELIILHVCPANTKKERLLDPAQQGISNKLT